MIDENMMVALPFIHKSPYPLPPTPPIMAYPTIYEKF